MPQQPLNHANLNVVESGTGPETLILLHGLLFSHRMFDAQAMHCSPDSAASGWTFAARARAR